MIINSIEDFLELYEEFSKLTVICLDSSKRNTPLFMKGMSTKTLIKYTEYNEVIEFLKNDEHCLEETGANSFHTLFTKSSYVYNIVRLHLGNNKTIELIAGPMLNNLPNSETIDMIMERNQIPLMHRYRLVKIISTIPITSDEGIYLRGHLLVIISRFINIKQASPTQKIHGKRRTFLNNKNLKQEDNNHSEIDMTEYQSLYRFYAKLMFLIAHGDLNKVIALIGEYSYIFYSLAEGGNHYRLLKNRCIISSAIACHYAIEANAPHTKIFYVLSKAIAAIERSSLIDDIISVMNQVIITVTHEVATLSENHYSIYTKRALHYIKTHFEENITLKSIAEHIHINHIYLSRLINNETKTSLSTHINLARIEESKYLLIHSNKSIQEIAIAVGYNYQNHFNTIFKKLVGITPLEYRQNNSSQI